jgi:hypothetical protein
MTIKSGPNSMKRSSVAKAHKLLGKHVKAGMRRQGDAVPTFEAQRFATQRFETFITLAVCPVITSTGHE